MSKKQRNCKSLFNYAIMDWNKNVTSHRVTESKTFRIHFFLTPYVTFVANKLLSNCPQCGHNNGTIVPLTLV